MKKTYISSLLVVLMAGAQGVWAADAELDALLAEDSSAAMGTETMEAPVEGAEAAMVESGDDMAVVDTSIEGLMEAGIKSYNAANYDEARLMFEAVIAKDAYNRKAMIYLRKVAARISALEEQKKESVRASSVADVKKAWTPDFGDSLAAVELREKAEPVTVPAGVQKMTAHLKGIEIPSLDFRDANIKDVVLFLTETCRRMDSTGKGVNIILLGLSSSDAMGVEEGNNITISIRDMSLYDALQVIVEMASLKFEIESNMVLIMPANYVRPVDVEIESISVVPEVGEELSSMAGGADSGDTMDDLFGGGDSGSMSSDSGPIDVSGYFSIVTWPEQASATYYPNFRKLIVKHTREDIRKIRSIVDDLEDEAIARRSSQVEIEAKFVEFSEGNLEELGFDWSFNGTGDVGGFKLKPDHLTYMPGYGYVSENTVASLNPNTGQYVERTSKLGIGLADSDYTGDLGTIEATDFLFDTETRGVRPVAEGQSLFGGAGRSGSQAFEGVTSGILSTMGGMPASMMFTDDTINLQVSAMEQNGTADILSAPKVTTQSGYEAVIRVTEIHRYPQDWDVETGQRTAPVVKPQDWEDFDLGVVLRVTPEVDAESNTIKLELNPEIRVFKGFDGYHVADNAYDAGTSYDEVIRGDGTELFAEMPYFETRSVQTRVTVADGSTVMMGGLVDETTETFRDQIPILGDIPYIGRLFRNEGTRSAKKNLVIFVKATQVDEKGMTRVDRAMARKAVSQ